MRCQRHKQPLQLTLTQAPCSCLYCLAVLHIPHLPNAPVLCDSPELAAVALGPPPGLVHLLRIRQTDRQTGRPATHPHVHIRSSSRTCSSCSCRMSKRLLSRAANASWQGRMRDTNTTRALHGRCTTSEQTRAVINTSQSTARSKCDMTAMSSRRSFLSSSVTLRVITPMIMLHSAVWLVLLLPPRPPPRPAAAAAAAPLPPAVSSSLPPS